jgi:thiol-disulfide isomerase/thioredoxin
MISFVGVLLAVATTLSPILNAGTWLGSRPAAHSLDGKVVIVDVFTFDCINCKHVVPELRTLRKIYPDSQVAIVGVHSPETPYEHDRSAVAQNLALQGITWPVAIDNDFALWNAYGIQYWPTQIVFDRHGRIRKTIIGEGQDALLSSTVRDLLAEH